MTNEEIGQTESKAVGSMKSDHIDNGGLPSAVYELYNWLLNDELRSIKAQPVLAYYSSLKQALRESFRVLMPNGLAIYVIGKESIFYQFKTREVLFRVACDDIFSEIAKSCGFIAHKRVDVELDKKNKNARPRSLDSYYETIYIFKKPESQKRI